MAVLWGRRGSDTRSLGWPQRRLSLLKRWSRSEPLRAVKPLPKPGSHQVKLVRVLQRRLHHKEVLAVCAGSELSGSLALRERLKFTLRPDQPKMSRGGLCGVWTNESETRIMIRSATNTAARSTSGEGGAPKKNCLPSMP